MAQTGTGKKKKEEERHESRLTFLRLNTTSNTIIYKEHEYANRVVTLLRIISYRSAI
jgi:hypothetical protein